MKSLIYHKNTLEFVTVAVEFCSFLETADAKSRESFLSTCVRILPLLYLKGTMLPEIPKSSENEDESPEQFVTEVLYSELQNRLLSLLGESDSYLEVFHADMAYSEAPLAASISEDLSDIYQDIKDFTERFRMENDTIRLQALALCQSDFAQHWGQKLVNVMRPLHPLTFCPEAENEPLEKGEWEEFFHE